MQTHRRICASPEKQQPLGEFVRKPLRQVGVDLGLLHESEAVVLVADPNNPVSQFRRTAGEGSENRGRHVIDVDEASVIELPSEIRSADPQLPCKGGITFHDLSCLSSSLPTFEGFTDRWVHTTRAWYCPARRRPRRGSLASVRSP